MTTVIWILIHSLILEESMNKATPVVIFPNEYMCNICDIKVVKYLIYHSLITILDIGR